MTTTTSTGTALIPASDPKREQQQQQQQNDDDSPVTVAAAAVDGPTLIAPLPPPPVAGSPGLVVVAKLRKGEDSINNKMNSSGYAMTAHSAEIIDEDVYVSDGSESDEDLMAAELPTEETKKDGDEEEETSDEIILAKKRDAQTKSRSIEMVLGASKMGLMRRGIHHHSLLVQPNRQWSRQSLQQQQLLLKSSTGDDDNMDGNGKEDAAAAEERRRREEEEELAKLDPAQRAARLLAEKQRKLEEAKIAARRLESEENAGRDPCLFSKRTSFDIRFDQIEDKPWTRGGDLSDFFNYGFQEEDWLEYAEQQLLIRQELMDANRQKRPPDPGIVPVAPKAPKSQTSRVTLSLNGTNDKDGPTKADNNDDDDDGNAPVAGPQMVKTDHDMITRAVDDEGVKPDETVLGPVKNDFTNIVDVNPGVGGAWATPAPGSKLAQLIAEQERQMEHVQQHPHDPFIVGGREPSITDDIDDTMSMVSSQIGGPGQVSNRHPPPPYHHQHQHQQEYHAPYPPRGGGGRGGGRNVGRGRGPWNPGRGGGRGDWNNHGGDIGYGGGGGGPPPDGNWNGGGGGAVYNNFHNNNDHRGGPPPPPPPPLHPHGPHSPRFQGRGGGGFRGGRGGNGGRFGGRGGGRGPYR